MNTPALALSIASNVCRAGGSALLVSLTSTGEEIALDLLCAEARVDKNAARTDRLSAPEHRDMETASKRIATYDLAITTHGRLTIAELREDLRMQMRRKAPDLIVLDSLHRLTVPELFPSRRRDEVGAAIRTLKELAMELAVPIVATASVSRYAETRGGDKSPRIIDLADSEALEEFADNILFLHRLEVYGITINDSGNSTEGIAEIIISKQRSGPIGVVELAYIDHYERFENLTTHYQIPDGDTAPIE